MQITVEDVAELRKQGSFREFLRLQFAPEQITAEPPAKPEPAPAVEAPRSHPGAWPTGTRPPDPIPALPAEAWQQAVHDYRAWLAAGQPPTPIRCECGCTPGTRMEANR